MSLKMHACKSTQLSKKGQKEIRHIEDIVMGKAEKECVVVILDVKDYIKESGR